MRRLFKWLVILGVLAGAGYGIAVPGMAWWRKGAKPRYLTSKVSRGRVEAVVNSTGTIKPVRSVSIGAFVSGPISEILVDYNSMIKKNDLLARIDPRLLQAAVDRDQAYLKTQEAELARIEALLMQAQRNEERAKKLMAVNKDYLSDTEMDQYRFSRMSLEAQKKLAQASIVQAQANLKNSEANLGYTEIRSPVDGIVIERKVDPGQTVASSFQTPEMFIVAPDMDNHMHVFASVDEADIGQIRSAQELKKPVLFTVDAFPQDTFQGHIYQVRKNSTTTQNVVTYPVVIEATNPDLKLMPGMTANISFQIEVKEDVKRVPTAALRFLPPIFRVHPEDRHHLDAVPSGATETDNTMSGTKLSATQKAALARSRSRRLVWYEEGQWLRAVPITVGLIDNQNAELLGGDLEEGQKLVTAIDIVPSGGR
jgi:HlyD family secretion protein